MQYLRPGFGERKSQYLDNIEISTGSIVIREEVGFTFDKARKDGSQGVTAKVYGTELPYASKNWPQQGDVWGQRTR